MIMNRTILFIFAACLPFVSVSAQNETSKRRSTQDSGNFSVQEYWNSLHDYVKRAADLSDSEAQDFFPVFDEFQKKKRDINRRARQTYNKATSQNDTDGKKEQITEQQALEAIDAMAESNLRIAHLEKEYLEKFKTILPASKILKAQTAQEEFNSQMLKDIQKSREHQYKHSKPAAPGQEQESCDGKTGTCSEYNCNDSSKGSEKAQSMPREDRPGEI